MWTRTYLLLLAVRLYFALSPSYIHPDENFQGPEVIAGKPSRYAMGGSAAHQPHSTANARKSLPGEAFMHEACLVQEAWSNPSMHQNVAFIFSSPPLLPFAFPFCLFPSSLPDG